MSDILFLAHRVPYPPDRGDKIRSHQVLRYLAARARVHLLAFADDPADETPHPELLALCVSCTIIPRRKGRVRATLESLTSGRPVSLAAFDHPGMRAAVANAPRTDATYCFSGQMAQYLPDDRPAVMDFVDVDSAKFAQMGLNTALLLRPLLRREARLLGNFERAVARRVDASLFVTEAEAALFRGGGGGEGRIVAVENGIDARHFSPDAAFKRLREPGPLIAFTGQMNYAPNIDAVTWFTREVLPAVRRRHAAARFAIVGRAPTPAVRALAGGGVIVTGAVPDVRPWLAAAAVCVAPLRLARGVQNKVLEAMAMARPVIASPGVSEGIDHAGTIAVANGAAEWVEQVCAALDGAGVNDAARRRVIARYDWPARLQPLDALLGLERPARAAA